MRFITLLLALLPFAAFSQNSITFTASATTGTESVVPDLTWSTLPTAQSCTASGSWTGTKAAMGHEVLPAITTNATYVLTCTWAGDTTATLTWTNPTKNTDGSNYTNPKDIIIKYGPSGTTLNNSAPPCTAPVTCIVVTPPTQTTRQITGFTPGSTVDFVALARNTANVISDPSMKASKTFSSAASDMQSIAITVNAKPQPITGVIVQ